VPQPVFEATLAGMKKFADIRAPALAFIAVPQNLGSASSSDEKHPTPGRPRSGARIASPPQSDRLLRAGGEAVPPVPGKNMGSRWKPFNQRM